MSFFKKDPVTELKKILEDLKVSKELLWHKTNQEDLYHILEIIEKELPLLEGMTLKEAQEHPEVQKEPLFKIIVRLFAQINDIVAGIKADRKKKIPLSPDALKQRFKELDDTLDAILREEYLFIEERSGRPFVPQEISEKDAGELDKARYGAEIKFMIGSTLAKFWSNPSINHDDIAAEYFGKKELGGTVLPAQRIIEIYERHSPYTHEQALLMLRRLGASPKTKVLHGFFIKHRGTFIGRFICKYGGAPVEPPVEGLLEAGIPVTELRFIITQQINAAQARGDFAKVERLRQLLRKIHVGD